ncbi:MAG: AAA family ATPase [Rhodobacteraceae bacterium]|nr:AAA family ATPase [Paracoccaceae bacterium]
MSSAYVEDEKYPRGSEWRVWDLHIHTPASFHWNGKSFGNNKEENKLLVDEMIRAMNAAEPAAFAIMDYWTFDGWFALQNRLKDADAPTLEKTVFPGIELRICTPTTVRLNAHAIFSDKIDEQHLKDFRSSLKLELSGRPLSNSSLADFAKTAGDDKLKKHGTSKREVAIDDSKALAVGSKIAEVTRESYKEAIAGVPEGMAFAFMPFSTHDGLENVDWNEHYAFVRSLFTLPPIFEARKYDQWAAFAGVETEGNKNWFGAFQAALDERPRLAVSGSDAHQFIGLAGSNDKRGYGDFPSAKKTWIKANPTWEGLNQVIKEPANRSFIGSIPPKLEKISANKTFYIDSLKISKDGAPGTTPNWLDNCHLKLNKDLVAIIGNKGSGKSALADIIALLGQSQQSAHFSFLTRDRFRGKIGEPARFFRGHLKWLAGADGELLLSENPEPEQVELVRYIPQGRFEALCNDHVSGKSNEFERELRSVIYAHVSASERAGSTNFDQLIERLEDEFRKDLGENRKELSSLNEEVSAVENQLHPTAIKNVDEQLKLVELQRDEHLKNKPIEATEPAEEFTPEQAEAQNTITKIDEWVDTISKRKGLLRRMERRATTKIHATQTLKTKIKRVEQSFQDFMSSSLQDATEVGLKLERLASLKIDLALLDKRELRYRRLLDKLAEGQEELGRREREFLSLRQDKANQLAEPQQKYQAYLQDLKRWQDALTVIEGSPDEPESRNGILARIIYLGELPGRLMDLRSTRKTLVRKIFRSIEEQRKIREALFAPLQSVIQGDVLIPEEYQLSFQAKLDARIDRFSSQLFDLVKQNSGNLRGEDKSLEAVRDVFEAVGLATEDDAVQLTENLFQLLDGAARNLDGKSYGLEEILRKDRSTPAVYDHIFGLSFIEPKYTLLFQETQIEQLSPGQRGALLLIFYLLVDKGRNPIVLDQPEENLDNQTIVSLLVPVLEEAKKSRQIFMVTHNPNLAVVCDAEQIIHATFNRKDGPEIRYSSGAIESKLMNQVVVDVLEGTKLAFNNRGGKYH